MKSARDILTEENLHESNWGLRIIKAEQFGGFNKDDRIDADYWSTCPCSELGDHVERNASGDPADKNLNIYGMKFDMYVANDDSYSAALTLIAIKKLELLAGQRRCLIDKDEILEIKRELNNAEVVNVFNARTGNDWYEIDGMTVSESEAFNHMEKVKAFDRESVQEALAALDTDVFGKLFNDGDYAEIGNYITKLFKRETHDYIDGYFHENQRSINSSGCPEQQADHRQRVRGYNSEVRGW